jgi:hypothetical protein
MNTENKVFNKLFFEDKVELASQKIELSNLQDLSKIIASSKSILSRGSEYINKKTALQKEAKVLNTDSKSLLTGGEKLINDFIKSAKVLGVNVNSVKEVQMAIDAIGALDTVVKQTQPF